MRDAQAILEGRAPAVQPLFFKGKPFIVSHEIFNEAAASCQQLSERLQAASALAEILEGHVLLYTNAGAGRRS